ncbi:MAG: long-chain acyl-CoA synthetase [Alphaproteobacteria bacterium]|jgi:long-chain acyl-CoA synthetase
MDYEAANSLPEMFFQQAAQYEDKPFLWRKHGQDWRATTWREAADAVVALSHALMSLGVNPGDRVVIASENRPEWLIADFAIMNAGAISVPAYTTNTVEDHLHVLTDSGAKLAIVSTPAIAARFLPAAKQAVDTQTIIAMEPGPKTAQGVRIISWDDALTTGSPTENNIDPDFDGPDFPVQKRTDTACIIYTSGTGGAPKGVMLSHGAILFNCMGADALLAPLPDYGPGKEVFLSFLPLSHSYEHTAGQFFPVSIGAQIYYAAGLDKLVADMAAARPTIMTAVPRLYETIHARIRRGVEQSGKFIRALFMKTVSLGHQARTAPESLSLGQRALNRILDRLVRRKVADNFGGRLKAFVSGGAPLNPEIGDFFLALGVRILQGYGQTESAPVISCNPVHKVKIDTVGPPLKGVSVRIAEDGEILVQGELVMQGYWRNDSATKDVLHDGWLHTGDIGEIDADGYIRITDRKKDIIVNSGGDNLSPQRIEGMLSIEPEINQAMVYGDKRPHIVALVIPDPDFMKAWASQNDRPFDPDAIVADADFRAAIDDAVGRVNAKLSLVERVRRFNLTAQPFTTENEMMTPSLKIRRHVIKEHFGAALEALYGK